MNGKQKREYEKCDDDLPDSIRSSVLSRASVEWKFHFKIDERKRLNDGRVKFY
jgi:hypothetical protein